jgi:hypothetical protein
MADEDGSASPYAPGASQVAGGLLDGQAKAVERVGEGMLKSAKPSARFLLKRIPGAPALVFDLADVAMSPNKTRAWFGLAGGLAGGAAGGALGAAAGGVNAPIGAAVGSAFGQGVGERIYDDHAARIDRIVSDPRGEIDNDLDATKQWMNDRWRHIAGQ